MRVWLRARSLTSERKSEVLEELDQAIARALDATQL
jgi:hypothetical protein